MPVRLTQSYVNSIKPNPDKPIWVTDAVTKNLKLYVGTSGTKVWYVYYRIDGRKASHKLGPAGEVLTVAVARDMANEFLGRIAKGENPKKQKSERVTLGDFLENVYQPWVTAHRRSGQLTMGALRATFRFLYDTPVQDLRPIQIQKWRTERMGAGWKAASANRRLTALKAAINWGVRNQLIDSNPLAHMEALQESDSYSSVRYLSSNERECLMAALDAREKRLREERVSHNAWLVERGHKPKPLLDCEYADHIKPMVLFSLNTGIRQGSLFSLQWSDIDFNAKAMTIRGAVSKTGKTHRVPLNSVAIAVLSAWHKQCPSVAGDAPVFPSPVTGGALNNVKKAWAGVLKEAQIDGFRWHDMRHDFASQLVMKGIDLNTVRELLGHADMKMTLRYAHLAPESKLRAVEVLTEG